jgi:enoyl-CoA hydratase
MVHNVSDARTIAAQYDADQSSWSRGMVRIERRGEVAVLILDRPDKLNAISRACWSELRAGLDWIGQQHLRAVVLTGAGDRAFSVGGDIGSFAELTTPEACRAFQAEAMATFAQIATSAIPIIAAINGLALGGGCELAMACDFVLAGESATFGLPEARFGLVPGYGVLAAPEIVGPQMARLLIFTGETLTAEEALRCGLAQKLCPEGDLEAEALRLAHAIAHASREAITAGKAMLDRGADADACARSIETISKLHGSPAARRAVMRFLDDHRRADGAR